MKKISYVSPVVETMEVEIEKGFAASCQTCCWGELGAPAKVLKGTDYSFY